MTRIQSLFLVMFLSISLQAQTEATGGIAGKLTDKEMNGEPLPFANVHIIGTSRGATTDIDGLYSITNIKPGTYDVVFSFVGYETLTVPNVQVLAGKVTGINSALGSSAASLDEVVINTVARKDSEVALLLEQKRAIEIKESIGARELAKLGISDVATATTRISGVTSSEASGDIFVRGLGDRYLYTTLNGLPIPSDDVERKNIDLELFPTGVIQSLSISKTYSASSSADQASGNINIETRELVGQNELQFEVGAGINTNVLQDGVYDNFKVSPNSENVNLGFYSSTLPLQDALTEQTWNPSKVELPLNYKYGLTAGKRIGEKFEIFFTGTQSTSHEYREGIFREYRANFINDSLTDARTFSETINTTGLINLKYKLDPRNVLSANSLFINKLTDEVFEGGRNGEGFIFEETAPSEGLSQFVRDQNLVQTRLWINQITGIHEISGNNTIAWAAGYNTVNADEPNRIRNEVNFNENLIQLGRTGGFQQRKSSQEIVDNEINALVKDQLQIIQKGEKSLDLLVGGNFRNKERDFASKFFGLEERTTNTLNPVSLDNLSAVFTAENLENGLLDINDLRQDSYNATLQSYGGFLQVNYQIEKLNINAGFRYQNDELDVNYDVGNIPGRVGASISEYNNLYPALNLKYSLNDLQNLRLAASKTITLPEFKEIAPFEYVSQTGQITRGNPDLAASTNYNVDLKWEYFPSTSQLFSLTGFYKLIQDPINKVQDRGSAGVFSFFNAGKEATIYGLELETKIDLTTMKQGSPVDLNLGLNASRMWHTQGLKEEFDAQGNFIRTFRYKGLTETGLQGASDWIFNGSLNLVAGVKNPFMASLVANYASDKIFALGAPEIQTQSEIYYNDAIIEKGFLNLDAVISQDLGEHWGIKLTGKNLLNPEVKRVQNVKPSTTGIETTETVRSYTRGTIFSFAIKYSL